MRLEDYILYMFLWGILPIFRSKLLNFRSVKGVSFFKKRSIKFPTRKGRSKSFSAKNNHHSPTKTQRNTKKKQRCLEISKNNNTFLLLPPVPKIFLVYKHLKKGNGKKIGEISELANQDLRSQTPSLDHFFISCTKMNNKTEKKKQKNPTSRWDQVSIHSSSSPSSNSMVRIWMGFFRAAGSTLGFQATRSQPKKTANAAGQWSNPF